MENMYIGLSDRITEVLDEYGILYGDIVDNGDNTVNIVGVDESEWDDVVDAIENELGLEVEVPSEDHEEFDDELVVIGESLNEESKKGDIGTQIGFSHDENPKDETEFDTEDEEEAMKLFNDFCAENDFKNVKVVYVQHRPIEETLKENINEDKEDIKLSYLFEFYNKSFADVLSAKYPEVAKRLIEIAKKEEPMSKYFAEGLKEAKEEDKLETFEDKMDFLAKDEQEAIDGYDKVIAMLNPEEDAFVIEQLTKIKIEEEAHKKYLEDVKSNKELEYTEPLEEPKKEEGLKEGFIKNCNGQTFCSTDGKNWSECSIEEFNELKDGGYEEISDEEDTNESLKEAQEGFVTFLNLECGVLLKEDHPEFSDYSVAYDHKHGYYDETYVNGLEKDLEEIKASGLKYIKEGVNGTYAILTSVDVQGTMEDDFIQDAIKDIEEGDFISNSIELLDGEQFKASNVIWSAYKDENGEIIENFVDTSISEKCGRPIKEKRHDKETIEYVVLDKDMSLLDWFDNEKEAVSYAESHEEAFEVLELHSVIDPRDGEEIYLDDRERTVWLKEKMNEGKELKEYNLPKDAKPYKTCGDKEYYIATFDDTDRTMMGNKATHTIVTKKVGGEFDMGSASGLDFDSEDKAKEWIDHACSLKEDVSDEVASKLYDLYNEGGIYFDTADDDGKTFLIVDGWEDVRKIQKALKPEFEPKDEYDTSVLDELFDNGYAWGFRDEYSKCDRCGNVIRTEADSYSWTPDFFVDYDNGEIICGDCVRENPKEYLETLYNNPEKANTILSAQDLINNGFEKIDGDYEDGWYDRHDSPEEILNKALEAHPNGVFIFNISAQGQFATQFELWGADLDLDESKKKDIKEGENFEKVTDHKVEIHHANGDVDTKFFDTHEEACDAYDKASIGGDIVKVCRYSADECEECKELEETYKDDDIIEFPEESVLSTMTFGDLVDMKIEQIYIGALDDIDDLEREYGKDTPELRDVILDVARQEAIDDIKFYNGHKAKKEVKR